ncbi:TPA: hypothetical protein VDW19_002578 [Pseudomonas aeruginosa]|nr:hypothetical protein [Pseudomonas aeruginosa]
MGSGIADFLKSGTTVVHSKEGAMPGAKALLRTIASGVLASLCLSAPVSAADGRQAHLSDLRHLGQDSNSQQLQNLAAPGSTSIRIVSTASADFMQLVGQAPAFLMRGSPELQDPQSQFWTAAERAGDRLFAIKLSEKKYPWSERESLCFVGGLEKVGADMIISDSGLKYVDDSINGGPRVLQSAEERLFFAMVHELQHCRDVSGDDLRRRAFAEFGEAGRLYGTALCELKADLAVALAHASKDGSFVNAVASLGAFRGASLADPEHATENMLRIVLGQLDASSYRGMHVAELYEAVEKIFEALDPVSHKQLRHAFVTEIAEKALLYERIQHRPAIWADEAVKLLPALILSGESQPSLDVDGRASRLVDVLLQNDLRHPDILVEEKLRSSEMYRGLLDLVGGHATAQQVTRMALVDEVTAHGRQPVFQLPDDQGLGAEGYLDMLNAQSGGLTQEIVRQHETDSSRPSPI